MKDLADSRLIKLKGVLFLILGIVSALLVVAEQPTIKVGLLLTLTIWCFCRAYHFAFYVIEHYVDPSYRFSGLGSFARHLFARRRNRPNSVKSTGGRKDRRRAAAEIRAQ